MDQDSPPGRQTHDQAGMAPMVKTVGGGVRIQIRRLRQRVGLGGGVIARCSEHPKEESAFIRKGFLGGEEVCKLGQKVR